MNTRPDQALKMLRACFKASNGFRDPNSLGFNPKVGVPGLGLWSGLKLLEIYENGMAGDGGDDCEDIIRQQIELNRDHEISLKSIPYL
ncbi:uncharacterized protein MELLADRAFT_56454 [Melampsora larici-populina 98AG31]|uniref:Uncharacterized protein n=1 Tax=Melampsora larici-populina (strain 98AG31 / pathotype 3-4-7) TaxID=747676 RepID=F4RQV1_MELLP|nr:uncharacterized protein MELLADRAFT_56454 [Melampsora larici-populina 98AG31]EGG05105.1 hypothetical protein MELLADRAFT_56454 [Melampsora larici-populina 98AG31]